MPCRRVSSMLRCPLLIPIRRCVNLAPVSLQSIPTDQVHDFLLEACFTQCKKIQARRVFDEMPQRLSEASKASKIIHSHILTSGFGSDGQLGKAILDLYAKCGDSDLTYKVFHRLEERDVLAWNSFMSMYSRIGLLEEIAKCFKLLRESDVVPNQFSYAIVLSACARLMLIRFGKSVHSDIIKMGFESNYFCEGSLVDMYVKCNYVYDARLMFDQSLSPTIVSSTALVSAYVQAGLAHEAVKIFQIMQNAGHYPDQVAYISLISAFVSLGRFDEAFHLFSQISEPNAVAWNLMISGHAKRGYATEAIKFFLSMRRSGVKSTRSTLGSVLSAIANLEALHTGMMVHGQAMKQGLDLNVYVGSSLVNLYAKCQELKCARKVFESLEEKNVVLWNAMLGGYAQNGAADEVVGLFINMKNTGFRADEFTYTSILSACGCLKALDMGCQLHSMIIKENLESNLYVANSLVDMYAKSGALTEARQLFELMRIRDNVSWNAMIVGYVQEEEENEALEIFHRMMSDGTAPDEVALASILSACSNIKDVGQGKQVHSLMVKYGLDTSLYAGSSLIDLYVKCGYMAVACEIFYSMPRYNVVSMNTLIYGFAEEGNMEEAVNLFRTMQTQGLKPSEITFANLLESCHGPPEGDLGRQIHCLLQKRGLLYYDELLNVSLLGMYMNSLRKTDATNLFSELPNPKSTVLWTSMISGLNQNGSSVEALEFYRKMRDSNIMPDQATFASTLKACSTIASSIDGTEIHSLIFHVGFNSDELISSALIDMYAKCGDVKSSMQVFKEMGSKWDVISWNSIIVGLAKNGYAEDALKVFDEMMESRVIPDDVTFLGVLTACSHVGKVSEGRQIFDIMTKRYGFCPRWDHYACMIDLFGRCGLLYEAEQFMSNLVIEPDAMIWASFLGACQLHGDEGRAQRAAEKLIELEPQNSSAYILLSNIYASSGSWGKADELRKQMNEKGVSKMPGSSWVGGMDWKEIAVI